MSLPPVPLVEKTNASLPAMLGSLFRNVTSSFGRLAVVDAGAESYHVCVGNRFNPCVFHVEGPCVALLLQALCNRLGNLLGMAGLAAIEHNCLHGFN